MTTGRATVPFHPAPSVEHGAGLVVEVAADAPSEAGAVGVLLSAGEAPPPEVGLSAERLAVSGFAAKLGQALVVPTGSGPTCVVVGAGGGGGLDAAGARLAAAAFARAAAGQADLAVAVPAAAAVPPAVLAQALVEGVLLARYRYDPLRREPGGTALSRLTLLAGDGSAGEVRAGAERGRALADATMLARDLANTPHSHLTASNLADLSISLGRERGLDVEVFDEEALREMGCGGLLGVNAGSTAPPRMIKLTYRPAAGAAGNGGRLALVGKGIMYDSGGIALKPGDEVHAQMKNDMSGAAAVLGAMASLRDLGCPTTVTAWLMCTDNMPSGTAMALGDVITMRGGTTVEVINTDAEGRLVMADALVLATEEGHDAIVDIATLTGACMRALGTELAGVMGNDQGLVDQIGAAAAATDEPVWQLPLEQRYRKELDSTVADLRNLGGANGGAITAALFLAEFVGDAPWAHIDIAGTAQSSGDAGWRTAGCTGFGARLLAQLAMDFSAPAR